MSTLTKTVNNALVYYDSTYSHRWYDAKGPSVAKYLQEFVNLAYDNATGDPLEWVAKVTETGSGNSTAVLTDATGGALLITTDDLENDGWQMQLGGTAGENVKLDGAYHTYFGVQFKVSDATQSDLLLGLCITDTGPDCLGGVTDGMYFRKVDGSTSLAFVTEKNSTEGSTTVDTLANNTVVTAEFLYDGIRVTPFIDGSALATTLASAATFPNDEDLRLTVEFLTGADAAKTMTINWLRMVHLRG